MRVTMNANLTIKGGKYYIVIDYKDTLGERKKKWISTGLDEKNNLKKAQDMMKVELRKFEDNFTYLSNPLSEILFSEWIKDWLEKAKSNLELSTYGSYLKQVDKIAEYFGKKKIKLIDLKPKDISDYYAWMQDTGHSIQVCEHHHVNIRKSLQSALKLGIIPFNPADRVDRPKSPKYIGDYYNLDDLDKFFKAIDNDPYKYLYVITAYYGLRRSELLGIKWQNIDFNANKITLKHAVVQVNINHKVFVVAKDKMKNTSSYRTLPLIPFVKDILIELKEKQNENKKLFGNTYITKYQDYICVGDDGYRVNPSTVSSHFKLLLKKHNLKKIRYHDLRHSCGSLLQNNGVSMKEIQAWLGHSNYNTTANIYVHLDDSSKQNMAKTLENVHNQLTEKTTKQEMIENRIAELEDYASLELPKPRHTTQRSKEDLELDEQLKEIEDLIKLKKDLIKRKFNLSEMD